MPMTCSQYKAKTAEAVFVFEHFVLAATYSPSLEVPSALAGLTAVFGMRTGMTPPPNHQNKTLEY